MKDRRARQVHNEHIPIHIDDSKESPHHGPPCTVTRKATDNQTFVQIKQLYHT